MDKLIEKPMSINRRTFNFALAATTMTATAVAAPFASRAQTLDKISVAVIPIADCAPIYLGKANGYFAKRNIDLTLSTQRSGNVIIPSVVSGQMQFGFSNVPSLLIAENKGLHFIGVAPGDASTGQRGHDFAAIIVPGDSPIATAKDLQGRTVAVNTLNNISDVSARAGVKAAGGDPRTVKFIEVPFPDMPSAIANHRIEAAWVVEPFLTIARGQGAKVVDWPLVDVAPNVMIAVYFTSVKYAAANPGVVKRLKAAIEESLAYAETHANEVRKIIPTYTRITVAIAEKITLPAYPSKMNRQSTQALADLCLQDGLITKKANISALLPT